MNLNLDWSQLKSVVDGYSLQINYLSLPTKYYVYCILNSLHVSCTIDKTTPANADQTDFETNYQPNANDPIHSDVKLVGADGLYTVTVDSLGRMSMNGNVTSPETIYKTVSLTNGSNANANVNGSSTNVNFRWSAPASETWYIEAITLLLNDNAAFPNNGFGALGTLTNGIQINIRSKGQVFTFGTYIDNYGIIRTFNKDTFSSVSSALLSTDRMYRGSVELKNRIVLDGDLGDYIELKVRDNLTGLTGLFASAVIWRMLG